MEGRTRARNRAYSTEQKLIEMQWTREIATGGNATFSGAGTGLVWSCRASLRAEKRREEDACSIVLHARGLFKHFAGFIVQLFLFLFGRSRGGTDEGGGYHDVMLRPVPCMVLLSALIWNHVFLQVIAWDGMAWQTSQPSVFHRQQEMKISRKRQKREGSLNPFMLL